MADGTKHPDYLSLTTEIVAAHLSHNSVPMTELPGLIQQVYQTLVKVESSPHAAPRPEPAVPVKKSVTPDFLVCLEDGRKLKMLKRHLKSAYNLTPEQYRERWGLPPDYPMVAPNYAKKRSHLARSLGLGTKARGRGDD